MVTITGTAFFAIALLALVVTGIGTLWSIIAEMWRSE